MSALVAQLRSDLTAAMRAGDKPTLALLRTVLAAISNAEAVGHAEGGHHGGGPIANAAVGVGSTERPRRELSESDVRAVITAEREERLQAADALADAAAVRLRTDAEVLYRYLRTGG